MAQAPPRPDPSRASGTAREGAPAQSGQRPKDEKQVGTFFLGRYRVVDEIGIGGMASVHLARMDGPGGFQKWVAIKRIHPHLVEDDQFVDMFLDEARIAAGINHANVAQVFDLGKDDNTYWIAMEYLHGEPLREVIRRTEERRVRFSPDLAARICSDAAEGLHAAHELRGKNGQLLGLVHRDVTPHNLFLTYDGYTKVVDFGIAKVADRLSQTRAGTLKGKLAYMSPEQVRGAEVDRTTDIFALGVVLWELTTSQRLFRMDTDLDTLEKVQACVVPPPSTVVADYPVELESIVMKALAKRKQDRFQTARELSRALQGFLMRRGAFVGPEEVAEFVRQVFSDRIQKREAHLAWAAEVTSTINVEQLRGSNTSLTGSNEDSISEPEKKPRNPIVAPLAPPSVQMAQPASPHAAPMPPSPREMASTSLMDDDEDVPTTVAIRNEPEQPPARASAPRPAAGAAAAPPAFNPQQPAGRPPPRFPQQFQEPDERTAHLAKEDLASTVAIPSEGDQRAPQQAYGQPQFNPYGPPQSYNGQQQQQLPPSSGYGPQSAPVSSQQQPGMQQPMMGQQGQMPQNGFPYAPMPHHHHAMPQSQIETALSLPRPDPAAIWLAQQERQRPPARNLGLVIFVVALAALIVIGGGVLLYVKLRAPHPTTSQNDSTTPSAVPVAETAAPTADPTAAPSASASADATAAAATAPTASATATATATATAVAVPVPTSAPVATSAPRPPVTTSNTGSVAATSSDEPGFLTIVCNPFCDEVIDQGKSLGQSPVVRLPVKPGQHRITLKKGTMTKVISVIVVSGQVTAQRVAMK